MISDIVGLAGFLSGIRGSLRRAKRENRDRLASYLDEIAACLHDAHDDLARGGSAVAACAQLHEYANLVPPTLEDVAPDRIDELQLHLRKALYVRGIAPSEVAQEDLEQLEGAAGTLTGLASYLRATD